MADGDAAGRVDRDRLVAEFIEWAKVNAPSGRERGIAGLLEQRLRRMGFAVTFDAAHTKTGGDVGNLIARWPGTRAGLPAVFLSTHMDTVLPTEGLRPVIRDGVIFSDGTTILGADDRAALAAYLEAIRVVQERGAACGPVELILTVSEQPGLVGAQHLDYSLVTARGLRVRQQRRRRPDHRQRSVQQPAALANSGPAGSHRAGARGRRQRHRDRGRGDHRDAAWPGGRDDGGERGSDPGRPSAVDHSRYRGHGGRGAELDGRGLQAQLDAMSGAVADAARRRGGTVDLTAEKKYLGFDYPRDHGHVQLAVRAAGRIGVTPYFTVTLGGADTNIFNEHGLTCITLGNGFRNIHSFEEHISIENLVNTARYAAALIEEFAATYRGAEEASR